MAAERRERSGNRRLVQVVAGGLATLLLAGSAGALGAALRNDPKDRRSTTSTSEPVKLTGAAKELVDLLGKRGGATYHARYQGESPDAEAVTLEMWQKGALARQDSEVKAEGQLVRSATFVLEASQVECLRIDTTPWSCKSQPGGDKSAADPFGAVQSRLGEGTVTAGDAEMEGVAVRCFRFAIEDATNELCLRAEDGIPVTAESGSSRLTLQSLETTVPDTTFTPPTE